jgi:molecular chaperone GrpE
MEGMKEDLESRGDPRAEETPAEAENPEEAAPDPQEDDPAAGQLKQLAAERDELRDLLLRKQAEFDNFRKRTERERAEFVQYASAELVRELLGVLDSFELALKNAESENGGDRKGFQLIHKQLVDMLSRAGLEPIRAEGQPFDPNIHEAVTTQAAPEGIDDGTVLADLRTGYVLKGKLLRPTMVVVAKSGSDPD